MYESSRFVSLAIDVCVKLPRLGPRALFRESEGVFDLIFHFHLDAPPLCRTEMSAQLFNGIAFHPGFSFFSRSIAELKVVIGSDMLFEPISQTFKKERAETPGPELPDRLADAFINALYVVIRYLLCRQAMRSSPVANIIQLLPLRLMGVNRIAIVFANKNNRQPFQCRKVQALVKDAFVHGTVAEKTCHDRIFALQFESVGKSDGLRNRRADYG